MNEDDEFLAAMSEEAERDPKAQARAAIVVVLFCLAVFGGLIWWLLS